MGEVSRGSKAQDGLNQMGEAALSYAKQGFKVVPIHFVTSDTEACSCYKKLSCENKGKHPVTKNGVHNATANEEEIRQFWQLPYNIGIACGRASGVWVLDVDPRNGGDESLKRVLAAAGLQETDIKTLKEKTGGGGYHYFFLLTPEVQPPKKVPGLPGLDFLSDGKICVVSPSTHVSGGIYEFCR